MKTVIDTMLSIFSATPVWTESAHETLDGHFFVFGTRVIPSAADANPILINRKGRTDHTLFVKVCFN